MRRVLFIASGFALGLFAGVLLWMGLLGAQARRHEPGLWTLRFARVLDCGFDYNGPPFTDDGRSLWVTCGAEDAGWQLWPPSSAR